MALRLFRTTGYSTLLMPGEERMAMHPGWLVLAVSLWLGLVCNVELWRELAGSSGAGMGSALTSGVLIASAVGLVLSLLGWRRTLKASATVLLFLGGAVACGLWVQGLALDSLWTLPMRRVLPAWPNLLRWQVPALFAALALLPAVWLWNVPLRRLTGPRQLNSNLIGMGLGGAILVAAGVLLPWH